jgi:hypothetical protein
MRRIDSELVNFVVDQVVHFGVEGGRKAFLASDLIDDCKLDCQLMIDIDHRSGDYVVSL